MAAQSENEPTTRRVAVDGQHLLRLQVPCTDTTHRWHLTTDGFLHADTTTEAHEQDNLVLGGLGAQFAHPCQQAIHAIDAARAWLELRLRRTAPRGVFNSSTMRFHPTNADGRWACCRHIVVPRDTKVAAAVISGDRVQPGPALAHARSVRHQAEVHNAPEPLTRSIAQFLATGAQVNMNPASLPTEPQHPYPALASLGLHEQHVVNLWSLGMTQDFAAAAVAAQPRPLVDQTASHAQVGVGWRVYRDLWTWWIAQVDISHLQAVADLVVPVLPHFTWEDRGYAWCEEVMGWRALDLSTQVAPYVAEGALLGLTRYRNHGVSAQQVARFAALAPASKAWAPPLWEWLDAGYDPETALVVRQAAPGAYPVSAERCSAALATLRATCSRPVSAQRLYAAAAIAGGPGRGARWAQTSLSIEQVAAAVAAKMPPGQAQRRWERYGVAVA